MVKPAGKPVSDLKKNRDVHSYQTKHVFLWRDFLSRQLLNIQTSLSVLREAGTLPRSPRIKWGADTPDVPLQLPSGTERMLMNAALARLYASSSDARPSGLHDENWC